MRRLLRWWHLTVAERSLVVQALVVLIIARLGLKVFPLRTLRDVLRWVANALVRLNESGSIDRERVAWAVNAVSQHFLDEATCLAKALTVQQLLLSRGIPAGLCIGVAKGQDGQLEAHAWVESEGRVIIGGPAALIERYTRLPSLDKLST